MSEENKFTVDTVAWAAQISLKPESLNDKKITPMPESYLENYLSEVSEDWTRISMAFEDVVLALGLKVMQKAVKELNEDFERFINENK